jgi:chaperonin GroES
MAKMTQKSKKTAKKARPVVKKVAKKLASKPKHIATKTSASSEGPLVPLHDRVVIRHLTEAEAGTANTFGIIIPDTVSKEKPEQGIVVATGPGKWDEDGVARIPMSVSVGDKVVFSKYGFDEVKVAGTEYYIVAESNILAIITE